MEKIKAYPVLIQQYEDAYLVDIPDWNSQTEGHSFVDAIAMARDAIGTLWSDHLYDGKQVPVPSTGDKAIDRSKDRGFLDFEHGSPVLTFVDVDIMSYNEKYRNRAVKKNCTIPYWLNKEAERRGINFSKVLQKALLEIIDADK